MNARLEWLGLEVGDLATADRFYRDILGLPARSRATEEHRYRVGQTELRLRLPGRDPPGGQHVHYAFSTSRGAYEDWLSRLSDHCEVEEHDFGVYRSMYCFDPDDHCVEIAGRSETGDELTGIFEVVLEVASLERAERLYRSLGFTEMDRGDQRRRVRLDAGSFELELWEPQRGLAEARGGEHVDVGFGVPDVEAAVERVRPHAAEVSAHASAGYTLTDQDGHAITLRSR